MTTPVNALVQLTTNNELDFNEWLDYHVALGFDRIFVYDTGNHGWLPDACLKRSEHVTLVPPMQNDWRKKRNIISAYVAASTGPSWAVCLADDEYLCLDYRLANGISMYFNQVVGRQADAVSVFVKYLSSEKPMKNRVGTLIDCFQHARPNPQGLVHPCSHTPNYSVTFFAVHDRNEVPMRGPLYPSSPRWCNALCSALNENEFNAYLTSPSYNPDRFPLRCYRYALKSGFEMGMAPGTKPVGYTVRDDSMLRAREFLLKIPANDATEELFAKDELLVEQPKLPERKLSPEEEAELELPIPLGRIDTYILYGYDLNTVVGKFVKAGYADTIEHRATIERVYRRECAMIAESSPVYRSLAEFDQKGGMTDEMICAQLKISKPALDKVRKCLAVLDLKAIDKSKAEKAKMEAVAEAEKAESIVPENDIAKLTEQFDDQIAPMSKADADLFDKKVEERREKRRVQAKKNRDKKKADKKSAEKEKAEPAEDKVTMPDVELDLGEENLLSNIDLSAFEKQ